MTDLTSRAFHIAYETVTNLSDSLAIEHKMIDAAYFQQGLGNIGSGSDGDSFVVFKDCQHKPVFTVRASSVVSIEEIRDQQASSYTINMSGNTVMSEAEIDEFCENMARRFRQQHGRGGGAGAAAA